VDSIIGYFWTPAKLVWRFFAAHSRCATEPIASGSCGFIDLLNTYPLLRNSTETREYKALFNVFHS
jgi:hypothetical protein